MTEPTTCRTSITTSSSSFVEPFGRTAAEAAPKKHSHGACRGLVAPLQPWSAGLPSLLHKRCRILVFILYYTVLYYIILYYTILYDIILYYAILYYISNFGLAANLLLDKAPAAGQALVL